MNRFRPGYFCRLLLGLLGACGIAMTTTFGQPNGAAQTNQWTAGSSYWTALQINPAVYGTPYRISLFNPQYGEDAERAWSQTKSVFAYGFGVIGILLLIPEESTGWNPETDVFNKWVEHVTEGPEWDRNNWIYNYVGHTYFGGVYYQVIRKSGYRQWDAFMYSLLMSTFYWEYGIEAFAEVPSVQDLVVTPLMGWVYGEWAYQTERRIRNHNNEVLGSRTLGFVSLCFLDPVDRLGCGVNRIAGRKLIKAGYGYFTYTAMPYRNTTDHQVYFHMKIPLGVNGPPAARKNIQLNLQTDPVDTGIVGIGIGTGQTALDKDWGVDDGSCDSISLGLYFTPRLSTRLRYSRASLKESITDQSVTYENYHLNTQVYLNTQKKLRPYLTAGLGEQLWEKDEDQKTFQWNGGLGVHWQVHRKWTVQADWINYYSPSKKTCDQLVNATVVYRFGRGEHREW